MNKFWMVWREGGTAPTFKHVTEQEANKEAERLANQFPHDVFVVLESLAFCRKVSVQWDKTEDFMPF